MATLKGIFYTHEDTVSCHFIPNVLIFVLNRDMCHSACFKEGTVGSAAKSVVSRHIQVDPLQPRTVSPEATPPWSGLRPGTERGQNMDSGPRGTTQGPGLLDFSPPSPLPTLLSHKS